MRSKAVGSAGAKTAGLVLWMIAAPACARAAAGAPALASCACPLPAWKADCFRMALLHLVNLPGAICIAGLMVAFSIYLSTSFLLTHGARVVQLALQLHPQTRASAGTTGATAARTPKPTRSLTPTSPSGARHRQGPRARREGQGSHPTQRKTPRWRRARTRCSLADEDLFAQAQGARHGSARRARELQRRAAVSVAGPCRAPSWTPHLRPPSAPLLPQQRRSPRKLAAAAAPIREGELFADPEPVAAVEDNWLDAPERGTLHRQVRCRGGTRARATACARAASAAGEVC